MLKDRNGKVYAVALFLTNHYADRITVCINGCMDFCAGAAPAVSGLSRGTVLSGTGAVLAGLDDGGIERYFLKFACWVHGKYCQECRRQLRARNTPSLIYPLMSL